MVQVPIGIYKRCSHTRHPIAAFSLMLAGPTPAAPIGPPATTSESAHADIALQACSYHYLGGESLDRIIRVLVNPRLLHDAGVDLDEVAPLNHLTLDDERKEITFGTTGYARTAKYFPKSGCTVIPVDGTPITLRTRDKPYVADSLPVVEWSKPWVADRQTLAREFNVQQFDAAISTIFDQNRTTTALIVIRHGEVIYERYKAPYTSQSRFNAFSVTKSLLAASLTGLMVKDGLVTLDDTLDFKEWSLGDPRRTIKVRDLLQMSSGLDYGPYSEFAGPDQSAQFSPKRNDRFMSNMGEFLKQFPLGVTPGARGRYESNDHQLLFTALDARLRAKGLNWRDYLEGKLLRPLGISAPEYSMDATGAPFAFSDAFMPARDWAKLGQLYVAKGTWKGRQILTSDFVRFVAEEAPAWKVDGQTELIRLSNTTYGAGFWIPSKPTSPLPPGSLMMEGFGLQEVIIVPDKDIVIVRQGHATPSNVVYYNIVTRSADLPWQDVWRALITIATSAK